MVRNKKSCLKCNKEISLSNYTKHEETCKGSKIKLNLNDIVNEAGLCICPHCQKEYNIKGIGTHIWASHGDGLNTNRKKGNVPWNHGLNKKTDERVARQALILSEGYKNGNIHPSFLGKSHTELTINQMKKNPKCGGIRKGSGRGKSGWYRGYYCDSTWELAYVIYNMENKIYFERNTRGFQYIYENEIHLYYPDFIQQDGKYVEIKGYMDSKNIEKIKEFRKNNILIVLDEKEIRKYLIYAKEKYGKDLSLLYDSEEINKKEKTRMEIIRDERKSIIRESNINFKEYGWGKELSLLLNISSQKSIKWVIDNMMDELNPKLSHINKKAGVAQR
jgi:hypothetical protein